MITSEQNNCTVKKTVFKVLSKFNKAFLPDLTKLETKELQNPSTIQKALIGWKLWVTKNYLDNK